jgi:leader peptidase (prepilin peptidase)/N-methyltransferase
LTGALFAAVGWRFGAAPTALLWCFVVAVLVALAGIDWDTTLLPDTLTFPLLWAGLLAGVLGWTIPLPQAIWGGVVGYLSLWSVYWLFKLTTGKEGMGYGDFKLLAALGAWLGWQMILPIVLGASVIGAVVGIAMKMSSNLREGRYVPFGPFLAGGGIVVMLAGQQRVLGWLGWA